AETAEPFCSLRTLPALRLMSREQTGEPRRLDRISREDWFRIRDAHVFDDDLCEHVPEVGSDGEIAALVPFVGSETRPRAVNVTTTQAAANHEHRIAMTVIRAAVAVLIHRPSKLRHRQNDDVRHAIAEIGDERRDASREVVEPLRELALR